MKEQKKKNTKYHIINKKMKSGYPARLQ